MIILAVHSLSTEVEPELFVDTSRNEKLRINLDIEFPKMSCEILHLDVMDVSGLSFYLNNKVSLEIFTYNQHSTLLVGENELDVDHDIFKQR